MTEISYRDQRGISASVEFLSLQEWMDEISVVLGDLRNKAARKEISSGKANNAGVIAWRKVIHIANLSKLKHLPDIPKIQAVYPGLKLDAMELMTVRDPSFTTLTTNSRLLCSCLYLKV